MSKADRSRRSNAWQVRDARATDLPALCALEALFPGDRLTPRQLRRHLASGRLPLRVAEDAAGLLGYALVFLRRGSALARLYSLLIAPRARGQGLGMALLRDAEAAARRQGRRRMRLEVRADNAAAIALYRAAGYREGRPRPAYYEDGAPARCFERELVDNARPPAPDRLAQRGRCAHRNKPSR